MGDLDLMFSQKKKAVKFDLILVDERKQLEQANEKMDYAVDDDEVDEIDKQFE